MLMTTELSGRHAVPVDEPAEPEVPERARRRVFSPQYKLRILAEYERQESVMVEVLCCDARGCTPRRSPNGVDSGTKARCTRWAGPAADRRLSRVSASWRGCARRMLGCRPNWAKPSG